MSDNFPNIKQSATEQSMDIGMQDPNGTNPSNSSAGGKTKIQPSADAPHSTEQVGYGYMSPDLKNVGRADSNDGTLTDNNNTGNTSGIPAAQPIDPLTFGNPISKDLSFREGYQPKHGFEGEIAGGTDNYDKYK